MNKYLRNNPRITVGELKVFLEKNKVPDYALLQIEDSQKPYCGSGRLYATNAFYDAEETALAFEF
ncbi:hypothetical protein H0A36_29205 [Endozoicomonas sp. SM1973]|uniref:Uncharacterized protein n=1 Tax=Spartinivicinus marinus TaxID=2994442 RepID=A0A853IL84_9GAMM|nr:hypothetical protein [Spartinivicinus marinus]MCX4025644.1 hypothetical protein [Spartinivicinus marinus]NYZ70097.1 hypothetical protein [Spartinivicinus marinus]